MTRRHHSRSVESLTAAFIERLLEAVERTIDARTRILATERMDFALATAATAARARRSDASRALVPAGPIAAQNPDGPAPIQVTDRPTAATTSRTRRAGTRGKTAVTPPAAPSKSVAATAEQERRDSEFARLRALLKPTGLDDASAVMDAQPARSPAIVAGAPSDPLRLLEDEIRDQAQGFAHLSATSCTARIAAWAGRVRLHQETSGNRVAAELLLDKLRAFARAMEAGRIEALNGSWRTNNWPSYIQMNEALAEAPQAPPDRREESLPQSTGEPDYRDVWSQPS